MKSPLWKVFSSRNYSCTLYDNIIFNGNPTTSPLKAGVCDPQPFRIDAYSLITTTQKPPTTPSPLPPFSRRQRDAADHPLSPLHKGPSIKYVTLEGEGVREGVSVCDRGGVSRACEVTLIQIFTLHMKHEI